MTIKFSKFQGTGNDFIMIDGRQEATELSAGQIAALCNRKFGVGADGVIILKNKEGYDFEMDYLNKDGSRSMCGNGGRCAVQFAKHLGILKKEYHFLAIDGQHFASIDMTTLWVNLKMSDVNFIKNIQDDFILNTGSPHYVKTIYKDLQNFDVYNEGKKIRYSNAVSPEGANINFVQELGPACIFVRTYERGVEDETLSCGTGATASALVFAHNDSGFNRIDVKTPGGKLAVDFIKKDENHFTDIWLCGPAEFVFNGTINV